MDEDMETTTKILAPGFKIGNILVDPPILQAPMAGFTNYAFRQIVRDYGGAGLQATEMVNARGFVWLDEHDCEHPDRLWGVATEARPLAVQIWDNDPETMAKVGRRLAHEYRVSVVDINFGCPVKQVTEKAHSGSYLLRDPKRMYEIITRLVEACYPTPVTAKIRLGCTRKNDEPFGSGRDCQESRGFSVDCSRSNCGRLFQGFSRLESYL